MEVKNTGYGTINSIDDVFKERYAYGARLVGRYQIPELPLEYCCGNPAGLRPVAFSHAKTEKKPYECVCHFFEDDYQFERVWNDAEKYIPILRNFKYVVTPDFSVWQSMSKTLQIYNTYRNRSLAWMFIKSGIHILPTFEPGADDSYEFVFAGLPANATICLTTNGIGMDAGAKASCQHNIDSLNEFLSPHRIVVVGADPGLDYGPAEVVHLESSSQQFRNRINGVTETPYQKVTVTEEE